VEWSEELNIVQYLYAHNGGGVAVGDINNDGLSDIYFTANQLPNKLYLNQGDFKFKDITEIAGVKGFEGFNSWTNGATMADINGDGYLDIYVSVVGRYKQFFGHNQLFINNGDLTFTESSEVYNLNIVGFSQQAYFFDYDLDGDLDMYQLRHAVHKPEVYRKGKSRTKRDSLTGDLLFNNQNNRFIDVSANAGIWGGAAGYGLAAGISDIDNNGFPDIYVSNDFHENDFLYYNNGDGTFTEKGANFFGHTSRFSMGNDISDINNDGWSDIITLDMKPYDEVIRKKSEGESSFNIYEFRQGYGYQHQYIRNMLQLNQGTLFESEVRFSEIGQQSGISATDWSWSPTVADFDNDGWKDLFITNGIPQRPNDLDYINFVYNKYSKSLTDIELAKKMPDGSVPNFVFKNDKKLGFKDVSKKWGLDLIGYSMGASYGDLDNDGDLDLVVNNLNDKASIYKNNSREIENGNFLRIKVKGKDNNTNGIGAKILVKAGGLQQFQEVFPTRGWLSSVEPIVHFGCGKINSIDTLKIVWPDGASQILENVASNTVLELEWENATLMKNHSNKHVKFFEEVSNSGIDFIHKENEYRDFERERLMLHKLSDSGPKLAVGDVNGDQLVDFYIGGAKNQAGIIYIQIQDEEHLFQKVIIEDFTKDRDYEDVDATFFDADSDGDLDLYVVSGGGEHSNDRMLTDRLYRNNGSGNFARDKAVNVTNTNGSVVEAADFDNDGHIDLFVGTRSIIGSYGLSPKSHILWNNGKGAFFPAKDEINMKLGMVTDATYLNEIGELYVVGEWMPITIVKFNGRNLIVTSIKNTSGWWNTIHANDMDEDGDKDLLVGNYGTNSMFTPTVTQPLGLYIKDFDANSSTDPILTYWKDGKEHIYVGLNELMGQLVTVRKRTNNYEDYAKRSLDVMNIEADSANMERKKVVTLESLYVENLGGGNYNLIPLPEEVQRSPIHGFASADFDGDGKKDAVAVGNSYGYQPNIGRADASYGNYLKNNGKGSFVSITPYKSGLALDGQARDITLLEGSDKNIMPILLVTRNNDAPVIFKCKL